MRIGIDEAIETLSRYEGAHVLLRFQDGKSDKFYGLTKLTGGRAETHWGRWPGHMPNRRQGQAKVTSVGLLRKTLYDKYKKGYKVVQIVRLEVPCPAQVAEVAYIRKPESGDAYSAWGITGDFLFKLPANSALQMLEWGIPIRNSA